MSRRTYLANACPVFPGQDVDAGPDCCDLSCVLNMHPKASEALGKALDAGPWVTPTGYDAAEARTWPIAEVAPGQIAAWLRGEQR